MDTKLRSWVNREGSAPRMWQRWTDEDESLANEAVAQWNGRPREERRVSAAVHQRTGGAVGAIGERCQGPSEGATDGGCGAASKCSWDDARTKVGRGP